ncbi:MAG: hypothetical protein AB7Q45_09115, partial [Planctomycetaceae bacterium]
MSLRKILPVLFLSMPAFCPADDVKQTDLFRRIKASIDAVPAIDTHDHLRAFEATPNRVMTPQGEGMTLHSIFAGSYYRWINPLTPWPASGEFDEWWETAQHDFADARATSFYRYLLPGFADLYGVDFDTITTAQARELNRRIFANYRDDKWLIDVVTNRANIELMFIDPYWQRLKFAREYKFAVPLLNVTTIMQGSHPDRFDAPLNSPFVFAESRGLPSKTFDDFLNVIDAIFAEAVANNCVCLKSTQAYQRTLRYENVSRERAEQIYGRSPAEVTDAEQQEFEDFMFWHVCKLSAKYDLPFQVHTGQARIQGSNPMLLVDLIEANPQTKFIL